MKMVVAIIRPERLACVQQALKMVKVELVTVTETYSYGREEGHTLIYRSSVIRVRSSPKLRVEILTDDMDAEDVVDALQDAGLSNGASSKNDGRIFVVALDQYLDLPERAHGALPARLR